MLDPNSVMVNIELAERDTPYCTCGAPTAPVGREGGIWLECVTLSEERKEGRAARFLRFLTEPSHVREIIVDKEIAA